MAETPLFVPVIKDGGGVLYRVRSSDSEDPWMFCGVSDGDFKPKISSCFAERRVEPPIAFNLSQEGSNKLWEGPLTPNTQSVFLGIFAQARRHIDHRVFRDTWDTVTLTGDITAHNGVIAPAAVGGILEKYAAVYTYAAAHQEQTHLFLYIGDEVPLTPEPPDNLDIQRFDSGEPMGKVTAFLFKRHFNREQEALFGRAEECIRYPETPVKTAAFILMTEDDLSPAWRGCLIHGEGETGKSVLALELASWLAEREFISAPVWVTINNPALMTELSKPKVYNPITDVLAGQVEDSTDPIVDYIAGHIAQYLQSGWRPEHGLRALAEELQKKKYLLVIDNLEIDYADEIMEAVKTITGGVTGRKPPVIITSRFNEKEAGHAQRIGLAKKSLAAWERAEVDMLVKNVMHNQPYEAQIDKDGEAFKVFIDGLYQHLGAFPGLIIQTVPLLEHKSITELNALLLGLHEKSSQEKVNKIYAAIFSELEWFAKMVLFALIASIDPETPLDDIKTGEKEILEKITEYEWRDADDTVIEPLDIRENLRAVLIDLERGHLIYHTEQNGKMLYGMKSLPYITFMFEEQFDEPTADGESLRDILFNPVWVVIVGLRTSQPNSRLKKYLEKVYSEPRRWVFLCLAASWSNRPEHIDLLLKFDKDIEQFWNKDGIPVGTPLQCAAVNGNAAVLQRLLDKGADYKVKDAEGNNLLHYAALNSNPAVIPILVNAGLDMYAENKSGFMPIQLAAFQPNPAVIKMFFDKGADPAGTVSSDGKTLLHSAALNKNPAVAEMLIDEKKLNVMATDKNGCTPLHFAVTQDNNVETIKLLLERGADINFSVDIFVPEEGFSTPGLSPIHVAACANKTPDNIDVLIEMGARVDTKDSDGETPLHWAARINSEPDIIRILLERGAAINEKDLQGATALYEASFNENPEVAIALITAGASLDDEVHDTILFWVKTKDSALKRLKKRKDWPQIKAAIGTRA